MSDTEARFYREWSPIPGSEVSEEAARSLTAYGRALFSDEVPRVFEMYSRGRLVRVEYRGPVDRLPGVRFAIRIPGPTLGDLAWSMLRLYTDLGAPEGFLAQLIGATGRAVMEVSYDVEGNLVGTTKYGYEEDGRLRYVFEYDETGTLVDLYDSPAGKSPPFDDVVPAMPDSAFYANGAALPSNVSPTTVDSLSEIVRRELARPEPVSSGRDDHGLS